MARLSRGFLLRLGLAVGSTLLSLLAAELAVRLILPQPMSVPLVEAVRGVTLLRPNVHGRSSIPRAFDTTLSTNSQRFRGPREFSQHPPSGVLRIATLGDSFTFGVGANDDQTYPVQLERILAGSMRGARVEVINAGVPGLGTGQEALGYDVWVSHFHPHLVILNVVSNDAQDDVQFRTFTLAPDGSVSPRPEGALANARRTINFFQRLTKRLPVYGFLAQHSQLFNVLRHVVTMILAPSLVPPSPERLTPAQVQEAAQFFNREGLPLMAGEIRWLNHKVQEGRARLVVVFVPSIEQIYPNKVPSADRDLWDPEPMIRALSKTCAEESIPFADLSEDLRRSASLSPTPLFNNGPDEHPTPAGYRAIAAAVASFVVKAQIAQPRLGRARLP